MIHRLDRILTEMPPPSDPDAAGAAKVQELMGGKFGEMSTFMNYTFQSFNFRNKKAARPFFELIANIAAEEFGHIELVAVAINTMLTGATPTDDGKAPKDSMTHLREMAINPHHFLAGGQGALCQDSRGLPWTGDNVFSSGDLVEDLTHNFFLETGARNNKLKVYEMCDHPAARALTGYLLVRGGVHQVAYARAVELLTGADLSKMFPSPRIPTDKIPESRKHMDAGRHTKLYRFSPDDYLELAAVFNGPHPETGEPLEVVDDPGEGFPLYDLPSQPAVFAPDYAPEEIKEIADKLRRQAGLPDEPTAQYAEGDGGVVSKVKSVAKKAAGAGKSGSSSRSSASRSGAAKSSAASKSAAKSSAASKSAATKSAASKSAASKSAASRSPARKPAGAGKSAASTSPAKKSSASKSRSRKTAASRK